MDIECLATPTYEVVAILYQRDDGTPSEKHGPGMIEFYYRFKDEDKSKEFHVRTLCWGTYLMDDKYKYVSLEATGNEDYGEPEIKLAIVDEGGHKLDIGVPGTEHSITEFFDRLVRSYPTT